MAEDEELEPWLAEPEGQYPAREYVKALVSELEEAIAVVYWNNHQRKWDYYTDPEIPGVVYNPYFYGDDEVEEAKPNLSFENVEIRWYKHSRRGVTTNVEMTASDWAGWYERCLAQVYAADNMSAERRAPSR